MEELNVMEQNEEAWEAEGDDGTWQAFSREENAKLSRAYIHEPSVLLTRHGHAYKVDFTQMLMVKTETKRTRRIRKQQLVNESGGGGGGGGGGNGLLGAMMGGGMAAPSAAGSDELLGAMMGGGTRAGGFLDQASAEDEAPIAAASTSSRRSTATRCRVEGCLQLHRYTDGFCSNHRSFAAGSASGFDEQLLPNIAPKVKDMESGEWKSTRKQVAMELMQTEESFLKDLRALKEVFLVPLAGAARPQAVSLAQRIRGMSLRGDRDSARARSSSSGRSGGRSTVGNSVAAQFSNTAAAGEGGFFFAGTGQVEGKRRSFSLNGFGSGSRGGSGSGLTLSADETRRAAEAFAPLQIEQIVALNTKFCSDLSEIVTGTEYSEHTKLGALLVRYAPYLAHQYAEYCSAHRESSEALAQLEQTSKRVGEYAATAQASDVRCGGKGLQSLLICPVQRLPRYELLVRELLKCTPVAHIDRQDLCRAYRSLQQASAHINEALNPESVHATSAAHSYKGMTELVSQFYPRSARAGLAKPGRQLVWQGELTKINNSAHSAKAGERKAFTFFLFSDRLLVYGSKRAQAIGGGYFIERSGLSNKSGKRRAIKLRLVRADAWDDTAAATAAAAGTGAGAGVRAAAGAGGAVESTGPGAGAGLGAGAEAVGGIGRPRASSKFARLSGADPSELDMDRVRASTVGGARSTAAGSNMDKDAGAAAGAGAASGQAGSTSSKSSRMSLTDEQQQEQAMMVNHDLSDSDDDDDDDDYDEASAAKSGSGSGKDSAWAVLEESVRWWDAEAEAEARQHGSAWAELNATLENAVSVRASSRHDRAARGDPHERLCCFHVAGRGQALLLQAKTIDEQRQWVAKIQGVVREHKARKRAQRRSWVDGRASFEC